jgi:hypothetical protein
VLDAKGLNLTHKDNSQHSFTLPIQASMNLVEHVIWLKLRGT